MMLDLATLLRATNVGVLEIAPDGGARPAELSAGDLQLPIVDVTIDSRSVRPGALFVALPGERADGHHFLSQALAAGALGCLVSRVEASQQVRSAQRRQFLFVVPDVLTALHDLALYWRSGQAAEIVGITGSIGKTTTKEITAGLLSLKLPVLKSEANFNTEIGLPLMLLRLAPEHRVAVLEMGMYGPGDIAQLARIAKPRIGVVTNVAAIHLERMGTIERIARAKSELIAALPVNGLAILGGDDLWTRAMAETSGIAPSVLFGVGEACDYRALDINTRGLEGTSFVVAAEGRHVPIETHVPGTHTVPAFLAAIAVARELDMAWDEIEEAARTVRLDVRQRILRRHDPIHGAPILIIDDSYNASPLSMNAALDLLEAAPGLKIAILGDMLELGPQEEEAHRQVGRRASQVADWLVVRGPRGEWLAEAAIVAGFPASRLLRAPSNAEAAAQVLNIVSSKSPVSTAHAPRTIRGIGAESQRETEWSVLVKGSRGMRMEEIVCALRGDE